MSKRDKDPRVRDELERTGGGGAAPDKSKVMLGILGLVVVVALTGLFGSGHTQASALLEQADVLSILRIAAGAVFIVLGVVLAVRVSRGAVPQKEDAPAGSAWLQVVLVFIIGAALAGWGVMDLL